MKTASIYELQIELGALPPKRLLELCVRLLKYKKENKELLTYLLFEAHDEHGFIKNIKDEVSLQFFEMNKSNLYLAKKSLRKILKHINKYIRYSGKKESEIELRMHFCRLLKNSGIPISASKVITKMNDNQVLKIKGALSKLHEDLQYDYLKLLTDLEG
jgi:hypothetical protein